MKFLKKSLVALSLSAVMAAVVVKMTDAPDEGVRLTPAAAAQLKEMDNPESFPPAMGRRLENLSLPESRFSHFSYMDSMREESGKEDEDRRFMEGLRDADCFTSEPKNGILPSNKSACLKGLPDLRRIMQERWRDITAHNGVVSVPELETIRDFSEKIARISGGDDGLSALGLAPGELSQKLCVAAQGEFVFAKNAYNDISQQGGDENKDEYAQAVNVLRQKQDRYCSPR